VKEAGYVLLRLPLEVRDIFKEFLEREYPDRAKHVISVLKTMRGGKEYDSKWGERMTGNGPHAWQIGRRFEIAARRLGLNGERRRLRTDLFTAPVPETAQLSLF
jgi:DNA repair photolyase